MKYDDSRLNMRLADLEMAPAGERIARQVEKVGDIISMTEDELISLPNIGRKSVNEVKEVLSSMGLRLASAHDDTISGKLRRLISARDKAQSELNAFVQEIEDAHRLCERMIFAPCTGA